MLKQINKFVLFTAFFLALWSSSTIVNSSVSIAQETEKVSSEKADDNQAGLLQKEIEKKIAYFEKRISAAEKTINDETAERLGVSLEDLVERLEKVKFVKLVYERAIAALKEKHRLEKGLAATRDSRTKSIETLFPGERTNSIKFYDNLLNRLSTAEQSEQALLLEIGFTKKLIETLQLRRENAERRLRVEKDKIRNTSVNDSLEAANFGLEGARLDADLLNAFIRVRDVDLGNLNIKLDDIRLRGEQLRRYAGQIKKQIQFSDQDLESMHAKIEEKKSKLQKRLEKLTIDEEQVYASWLRAKERLKAAGNKDMERLAENEYQERDAWLKTYRETLSLTNFLLLLIEGDRQILNYRYNMINRTPDDIELRSWKEKLETKNGYIKQFLEVSQAHQASVQQEILSLKHFLIEGSVTEDIRRPVTNRLKALQKLADNQSESITTIAYAGRITEQVLDEIDHELNQLSLKHVKNDALDFFQNILNTEIWVIDDRPITIKKVAKSLLILLIGILVTKYFIQFSIRKLFAKSPFKATTVLAIQKTVSYFCYFIVFLLALYTGNIPLTAFAFLGGAAAIGIGFGAQNLINNLISGFIIMGERPISLGDLIEVNGILGNVEEIGTRCTRVRTGENINILVPNSTFLERNITNWTHSDQKIRATVTVGVSYGSSVRRVEELLMQAANGHNQVLNGPAPFVIFEKFGDNSLIFNLYFWISITHHIQRKLIESDILFRIEELFREEGIVIAFPQRDLHFSAGIPVNVRMMGNSEQPKRETKS